MSDPFSWSVSLGRWGGTQVRAHLFLILFAAFSLLDAAAYAKDAGPHPVLQTLIWLGLLLLALGWHELGHALFASRLGDDPEDVRLWPLGNFASPGASSSTRSTDSAIIASGGLVASLVMAIVAAIGLHMADARMVFNPFGNKAGGAPWLADGSLSTPFSAVWCVGWFGYLNWVLFVANLIPALPFDNGRILRGVLASHSRDSMIAPHTARTVAVLLGLWGLIRLYLPSPGGWLLLGLALMIEFFVRIEIRLLEEVGFFEDGLFGYDFSQGYTSLEAGAPKVRPRRESALKRWRRRRSDLRRQRREAQEAAEESRLDEILAKLHTSGRSALTDEEQRFLDRVSAKIRNRRMQGS